MRDVDGRYFGMDFLEIRAHRVDIAVSFAQRKLGIHPTYFEAILLITEERYAPLIHAGVLDGRKILLAYRCVLAYIAGGLDINRGAANISRPTISRRPVSGAPIQYALKYTAAPTKCLLFSSAWRHTFTPKSEFARAGDGARDRRVGTELFAGGQEET